MSFLLRYSLPPLSQEEERELIKEARADTAASDSAVDTILRSNIKLIYKIAREFQPCRLSVDELVTEGTTGLVYAISKFDLDQDVRFTTYAVWWVKQKMRIAIANQGSTVRVPAKTLVTRAKLLNRKAALQELLGHEPSVEELAFYTELPEDQIRHLLYSLGYDIRITQNEDDDEDPVENALADLPMEGFLDSVDRSEQKTRLERAWKRLSKRDKYILGLRFGLDGHAPRTLEEVAQEVGRCRERVRQLQDEALFNLKQAIERKGE